MAALIETEIAEAINAQIGRELGASLQYLSIAGYFSGESWPAFSRHFFKQSDEERDHARRFIDYLLDVGAFVQIPAIPAPRSAIASAEEAVALALDWEKQVTRDIIALVDLAVAKHDRLTMQTLTWFIGEQREEMASMETLLTMIRHAGTDGLWHVEHYLARTANGGAE